MHSQIDIIISKKYYTPMWYLFLPYTIIVTIKVYEPPAHPTRKIGRWAPHKRSSFPLSR